MDNSNVLETAYTNEGAGVINMLVSEGRPNKQIVPEPISPNNSRFTKNSVIMLHLRCDYRRMDSCLLVCQII